MGWSEPNCTFLLFAFLSEYLAYDLDESDSFKLGCFSELLYKNK